MEFIIFSIVLIILIIAGIIESINTAKIKAIRRAIIKAKEGFISDVQLDELKKKFASSYEYFLSYPLKTKRIKRYIKNYAELSTFAQNWNKFLKEKGEIESTYPFKMKQCEEFFLEIGNLKKDYITTSKRDEILKKYQSLYMYFSSDTIKQLNLTMPKEFLSTIDTFHKKVKEWNFEYVRNELNTHPLFFNDIDGKSLDYQQRTAVVVDDDNNLVLAGAGSGKTLTISAKVKYLVEKKNVKPEEILLIAFTRKAAGEMTERIQKKLGIPVTAVTFHKLGLDIISQFEQHEIVDNIQQILATYFNTVILEDESALRKMFDFFLFHLNIPKDLQFFDSLGTYIDMQRTADFETLKSKYQEDKMKQEIQEIKENLTTVAGERVRSMEEVMIANYLFMNGINYEYEKEYPYRSEEKPNTIYHPDFYLTDYNLYLEHFGITKDNRCPWLSKIEEEKYLSDMKWKREFHQQNGTKLVETYSYYNQDNRLLTELQKILDENGVISHQRDISEIYQKIFANREDYHFQEFEKLIITFIGLFKANGYTLKDIENLKSPEDTYQSKRNNVFLDIVKPIIAYYQSELDKVKGIDFNDMINHATKYISEHDMKFPYRYIIIDEYQDISIGRYKLIKEIINQTHAKLMCVGDDWQSIYRFSGSDLTLFSRFEEYFGETQILKIEKTYRNSQELLDIATKFIERNPEQLHKNLVSDKRIENPIMVMSYVENQRWALDNALTDIYMHFGEEAEVLLLGRTNYDINNYMDNRLLYYPQTNKVFYVKYPKMKIKFLTVHSAKGLEADNVIILNMKNNLMGFPNRISDDAVLSLVLQNKDNFEFAEERRLFYVAITRTKNRTYLIAPDRYQSLFLDDLKKITSLSVYLNKGEKSIESNPNCPRCKKGYLVIREKNGKQFLGCSNYPYCNYHLKNTEVLKTKKKCPRCGGYLVERQGKWGKFLGCSNFPYCKETVNSRKYREEKMRR